MTMRGLMQERALDVAMLMRRAEDMFGHKRVVTATATGEVVATWGEVVGRARRLAGVLDRLGVPLGARVGTFGWSSQRHVELYLAAPSAGRVLHTLNHRLFAADLAYIVADAADDVLFVDRSLLPTVWPLMDRLEHGSPCGGDGRRRGRGRPQRSAGARLRRASRRGDGTGHGGRGGRGRRCQPVLHVRHDRASEGRALQPPVDRAAHAGPARSRQLRDQRARRGHADRPDVPRQRLGPAVRGRDGRRRPRAARPTDDPGRSGVAADPAWRHLHRRRAGRFGAVWSLCCPASTSPRCG